MLLKLFCPSAVAHQLRHFRGNTGTHRGWCHLETSYPPLPIELMHHRLELDACCRAIPLVVDHRCGMTEPRRLLSKPRAPYQHRRSDIQLIPRPQQHQPYFAVFLAFSRINQNALQNDVGRIKYRLSKLINFEGYLSTHDTPSEKYTPFPVFICCLDQRG